MNNTNIKGVVIIIVVVCYSFKFWMIFKIIYSIILVIVLGLNGP